MKTSDEHASEKLED
ncbi:hypothetical protein KGM_204177 [Danaus plexippus plexippus]|uniref:Uncharacterized protein n=1 Tax=Danaus plexippus plexippus TaxID=278856 RepID=A0A212FB27_DANPL|nr:hypothetical protein KGM_204177 [Danaus plexippus plexippus]